MVYLLALLLASGPVLWSFNRLKVRYVFSWFWTIFVCAILWGGCLALRSRGWGLPEFSQIVPLLTWGEVGSPALLLDAVSWPFALALSGLGLGVVLTSAQRIADEEEQGMPEGEVKIVRYEDWRNQAAILILMFFGLVGVLAGNPLTLLLAWAGGDFFGVWVLLIRIIGREQSERIVLDFSVRLAGIFLLVWAMVSAWNAGQTLTFEQIPPQANLFILLACGFRLGVLPLQVYFFADLPLRRGLGMMVRMVTPVVSSLVLLVRVAGGVTADGAFLYGGLLVLTAFAGLYAGYYWLMAKNEIEGRSFWVLGMASLAIASALRGQPVAAQAWGLALLLAGGGLFLFSARNLLSRGLLASSAVMLSALPGMPTAGGMMLFAEPFSWSLFVFLGVHALLMAGFVRHLWRGGEMGQVTVRAIRAGYALGLLILPGTFMLAGGLGGGMILYEAWWIAFVAVGLAGLLGIWVWRGTHAEGGGRMTGGGEVMRQIFSFHWLYRLFWRGYRLLGGGVALITVLLEGEAGVLWTLLLLFLLISLITTQAGLGG